MTRRRITAVIGGLLSAFLAVVVGIPLLITLNAASVLPGGCGPGQNDLPGGSAAAVFDPQSMDEERTRNVRAIVAVGEQMALPEQAIVIALAVASQESGFRNLANDGLTSSGAPNPELKPEQRDIGKSMQVPHFGVGHDHGSLGIMQQQYPWWGSITDLLNPQIAALKFYQALLRVQGWESMPVTVAAQTVQGSGFPDAYAPHESEARQLLAANRGASSGAPPLPAGAVDPSRTDRNSAPVAAESSPDDDTSTLCGTGTAMNCPPTGDPAEKGLTPDATRVLRCIAQQFGPHRWATIGERPAGVDRDHQEGRAVDTMIKDRAEGDAIANWATTHADELGIKYVIWFEKIWERPGMGQAGQWSPYTHPTEGNLSDTAAHRDHVHISVYGDAAGTTAATTGDGTARLPIAPGNYSISSRFGPRDGSFHAGLDFAASAGTPIYAVTGGTITQAGDAQDGYGQCVHVVSDDHTVETLYAHQTAGSIKVRPGQHVAAGDLLGAVGTTGDSTGPHLHYEVHVNGRAVDPEPYLNAKGLHP